ncbi:response regulator transcription factor [Frigidibacter sp. MR17.24]|uniref:response regulator transcription factor n=1 Tax=Frigidibacter sp. MR17.24 TaxID=3127345 RepID=UPI003012A2E8
MPKRVLLIEDEPNIAEAIRFLMTREGWEVAIHGEGAGALEAIRAFAPDVLVLDIMLPGRSGLELLCDIRAPGATATAGLPVLMLSARGQARDREAAERAGADRFLSKPFANAEVVEALRALAGA